MVKAKYLSDEIEIIIRFIESLNKGNCRGAEERVDIAIKQYKQLKQKIIYAEVE